MHHLIVPRKLTSSRSVMISSFLLKMEAAEQITNITTAKKNNEVDTEILYKKQQTF